MGSNFYYNFITGFETILMIIWLLIHKNDFNRPLSGAESRRKSEVIEEEQPETTSMASLRSAQSAKEMEKLKPQKLMTWNDDEEEKGLDIQTSVRSSGLADEQQSENRDKDSEMSSIEIRKIESDNYVIYMPPLGAEGQESQPESDEPAVVAFESDPQIGPPSPPNEEEEYTLEVL